MLSIWNIACDTAINSFFEAMAFLKNVPTTKTVVDRDEETYNSMRLAMHEALHALFGTYEVVDDILGADDALVGAPDISEERWSDVNRKFCELFANKKR